MKCMISLTGSISGHEIQKALTSLKLEISTEIRFIPNDRDESGARGPVRTDVKTKTKVRRSKSEDVADKKTTATKPRRTRGKAASKKASENTEG